MNESSRRRNNPETRKQKENERKKTNQKEREMKQQVRPAENRKTNNERERKEKTEPTESRKRRKKRMVLSKTRSLSTKPSTELLMQRNHARLRKVENLRKLKIKYLTLMVETRPETCPAYPTHYGKTNPAEPNAAHQN